MDLVKRQKILNRIVDVGEIRDEDDPSRHSTLIKNRIVRPRDNVERNVKTKLDPLDRMEGYGEFQEYADTIIEEYRELHGKTEELPTLKVSKPEQDEQQKPEQDEQPADEQQKPEQDEQQKPEQDEQQKPEQDEQPADEQQKNEQKPADEQPADEQQKSEQDEQPADEQQKSEQDEQPADEQQKNEQQKPADEQPADEQQKNEQQKPEQDEQQTEKNTEQNEEPTVEQKQQNTEQPAQDEQQNTEQNEEPVDEQKQQVEQKKKEEAEQKKKEEAEKKITTENYKKAIQILLKQVTELRSLPFVKDPLTTKFESLSTQINNTLDKDVVIKNDYDTLDKQYNELKKQADDAAAIYFPWAKVQESLLPIRARLFIDKESKEIETLEIYAKIKSIREELANISKPE